MAPRNEDGAKPTVLDQVFGRFFRREPRQSRSRAVVDAVLQVTEETFARGVDLEELSVERLSARAGIAMGSFYEYFSGKDSVIGVLIGRVTRDNFDRLAAELAASRHDTLEGLVRAFTGVVVGAYLAHPRRTRALVDGIGRLGLLPVVSAERDRFAHNMAARAMPYLTGEDRAAVYATMRLVADVVMGVIGLAAVRGDDIDQEAMTEELSELAMHLIRRHHPDARA